MGIPLGLRILKSAGAARDVPMYQAPTAPTPVVSNSALSSSSTEAILGPLHDTVLLIYRITTWESALDDYSDRVY